MKYPFLFQISADGTSNNHYPKPSWVVKVAKYFDYTEYDSRWMDCKVLGNSCLVPDVDLTELLIEFKTEKEALQFISNWWKDNPIED